ncbi:MAG: glycosyltransferase [Opitutaceae bacterium]|nr:glycosyltransferase [Opitutaceae bacterium]
MNHVCFILHELQPPADPAATGLSRHAWALAQACGRDRTEAIMLHTGPAPEELRHSLRHAAHEAGARYRHLEETPLPFAVPLLPAVPAHRTGLQVLHALTALAPSSALFLGHAAHAAAAIAAKRCASALTTCRLLLALEETDERRRQSAGHFPIEGRIDLATDFLERQAVAGADSLMLADEPVLTWLRAAGWTLPGEAAVMPVAPAGGDSRLAEWLTRLAAPLAPKQIGPLPRVSVCMPYFEQPAFLGEALAALAEQTQPPHEVIVVDDGTRSAAGTTAFAEAERRFAPRGWKFLRQQNAGPAAARNRAAREASGDALLFCDADNRFRPGMLATLARAMAACGADAVSCAFQTFRNPDDPQRDEPGYVFAPLGPCLDLGLIENVLGDTNFIVRRDVFLALGSFPEANRAASEDWQFLLELVRRGRQLEAVPAALFDYRLAAGSHARRHAEPASAAAALGAALTEVDPVWRRLWPHLAGLVRNPRLPQLEAEMAALRHEYAQAQQDAQRQDRTQRAHIALLEESLRQLEGELQRVGGQAAQEIRAARDAAATQRQRADQLESRLRQREDKIRRMEQSFSWQATAPLRALRRATLDRHRVAPPPASAAPASVPAPRLHFHFHLDAPRSWFSRSGEVTVRGWCFCEEISAITAIRARLGERTYPGTYGTARPDLAAVKPDWPRAVSSGFKIEAALRETDTRLILEVCDEHGAWHRFLEQPLQGDQAAAARGTYVHWVETFDTLAPWQLALLRVRAATLPHRPLLSVLMPVYNPAEQWLDRAIESVRDQVYDHWELCIADDASTAPHVRPLLEKHAQADARIKVVFREKNGHICAATNSALELATGDFTALFDHDDELAPHALYCVAAEVAAHPEAEIIYTDEDKIDEHGGRFDPHFKPDWNPDLLASQNYLCHLSVIRTATLRAAGGLRPGFEGSQDWDLFLRLTERLPAAAIRHIPRVLYHWRAAEGSTALHLGEKDYTTEAAQRALREHFERRGLAVSLQTTVGGHWRITYPLPQVRPLVSIIIPTRNAAALVRTCVASILARTNYEPREILLVNNRSDDPAALALFAEMARRGDVRLIDYDAPFNFSALNNFAARQARGEVLCFLNNDIEVMEPHWLDELVSHALRPGIGAVGARLHYPDMRLQHAGVITGLGGVAGHAFKHFSHEEPGTPQFRPHVVQNLSAVTAACLAIRRSVFEEAGGFEETELAVAFNDVDFCLKVEARGYRNLYTPFAALLHHESASRGAEDTPEKILRFQKEIEAIKSRWGDRLLNDPAYNPNLSLDSEDFALAYPPRVPPLVEAPLKRKLT